MRNIAGICMEASEFWILRKRPCLKKDLISRNDCEPELETWDLRSLQLQEDGMRRIQCHSHVRRSCKGRTIVCGRGREYGEEVAAVICSPYKVRSICWSNFQEVRNIEGNFPGLYGFAIFARSMWIITLFNCWASASFNRLFYYLLSGKP